MDVFNGKRASALPCLLVLSACTFIVPDAGAQEGVTLVDKAALRFGSMVSGLFGYDVSVGTDSQGNTVLTCGGICVGGDQAGEFTVISSVPVTFTVDPVADTVITDDNGNSMDVTGFEISDIIYPVLSGGVMQNGSFHVGATLSVPANGISGSYSGSYNLVISYQ